MLRNNHGAPPPIRIIPARSNSGHFAKSFFIFATMSGDWLVTSFASFSRSSLVDGSSSSFFFLASAIDCFIVQDFFAKASRMIFTCSAGVLGGMT